MKFPCDKGNFRSVYQGIWDNEEFQSFDIDTQWAFFLLRTMRECNFPCIYVFYRTMLYERLDNAEDSRIDRAIDRLIEKGWVKYEKPILWIVKGLKNDPAWVMTNQKQIKGIDLILRGLPKNPLIDEFRKYYNIPDTPTDRAIDTPTGRTKDRSTKKPVDKYSPIDAPIEERKRKVKQEQEQDPPKGVCATAIEAPHAKVLPETAGNAPGDRLDASPSAPPAPAAARTREDGATPKPTHAELDAQEKLLEARRRLGIPEHGNPPGNGHEIDPDLATRIDYANPEHLAMVDELDRAGIDTTELRTVGHLKIAFTTHRAREAQAT